MVQKAKDILDQVKYIDCNDEHGFRPLMKLVGDDMPFNHPVWNTGLPSEDYTFDKHLFGDSSQVLPEFSQLNVK